MNGEDQDDDGGEYQAHLADRQTDAWEECVMTGRPSALARYLECEGEVDVGIRKALIDILRNGPQKIDTGGRDSWRDYKTYVRVNSIMLRGAVTTKSCRGNAENADQECGNGEAVWRGLSTELKSLAARGISKTAACRNYAEQTNQELRTVEKQYERGRKIYGPEPDPFVRVDRDHEK